MKTIYLLLLCVVVISTNYAQVSLNWQTDVGGRRGDALNKICVTKAGGFLAAGRSFSNASKFKTENSRGGYDYWVVKYDSSGKIEWDKTIGGNKDEGLMTALTTTDGGYFLAGWSFSGVSGEKTEPNLGSTDYWLVKLNAVGNIEWNKTMGTLYDDVPLDAFQTNDGGYILLGDLGLTKIDNLGNVEWQNPVFTTHSLSYRSVQQATNGDYLLGGDTLIFNGSTLNFFPVILKTDELGNFKSRKVLNDAPPIYLSNYKALLTKDQNIIIYSWIRLNENKTYQGPIDIRKLDKQGNLIWRYTSVFDSFYIQDPVVVKQTKDGGFVFGASYQPQDVSGGNPDYIMGKIDSLGNFQWQRIIRGENLDAFADLEIKGKDRYLIGGSSVSLEGLDKTKPNVGNDDYWLLLATDTTTNNFQLIASANSKYLKEIKRINVYPNPVKDILHINNTDAATFTLTNQSGKVILTKVVSGNAEINVSHLPAGLYYLKNNATGVVQKIIITK